MRVRWLPILSDENGVPIYRYAPCEDAIVMLRGAELQVNEVAYGALGAGDEIVVDHGRVSINRRMSINRKAGS